ncbi:Pogo transposable element with KRAB domain [Dissostichus eleginoides]|uniref:Pogo transposable element with KRAB domain n=1 Tax=Dissostichus eleginoides TaxID=100907 RepID=A0AAD9B7R8_DISEL|nr:Pogo transposable element with KRAB domain [Dissostichus eleginoides]
MPPKRRSYTADFKLQVVKYAAEKGNRPAEREFGVSEKLVRDWCKAEATLISMKKTKRANRGLKARWPELEQRVHTWVLGQKAAGLSTVKLRLHAQGVAKEMKIIDFAAGPSWCLRFMKRNHVSIRAKMSQEVTDSQARWTVSVPSLKRRSLHTMCHQITSFTCRKYRSPLTSP